MRAYKILASRASPTFNPRQLAPASRAFWHVSPAESLLSSSDFAVISHTVLALGEQSREVVCEEFAAHVESSGCRLDRSPEEERCVQVAGVDEHKDFGREKGSRDWVVLGGFEDGLNVRVCVESRCCGSQSNAQLSAGEHACHPQILREPKFLKEHLIAVCL